jgi:uncharacterized membrane protein
MTDSPRPRLDAIDLLRGLVMVIMLLDHTRDYLHAEAWRFDPLDLAKTTLAIFFTRWVTHVCAPVFVFLAGTGAWLQLQRGKPKAELSSFLLSRGLWLIFLEFTAVRFGVLFNMDYRVLGMGQVLWAIGVSMIVLAGLVHLPWSAVLGFGLVMMLGHNALDGIRFAPWAEPGSPVPALGAKLWMIVHQGGAFPVAGWPSPVVFFLYPLIPWIGVMAAGFAFGRVYGLEATERRRWLLRLGLIATVGFVLLRATNLYGNPATWAAQKDAVFTVLSFLNCEKYPPSLLYLLMTLGPSLLALGVFERGGRGWLARALVTFGRVPLFFYLLQWFTAHGLSWCMHKAAGKPTGWLFENLGFSTPPDGIGFGLGVVYASWLAGLVLLYPLCAWFAGVKARRKEWWLSYL